MKKTLLSLLLVAPFVGMAQVNVAYFQQFSASNTLSDYVVGGATKAAIPDVNKFTSSYVGSGNTQSISNGTCNIARTTGKTASYLNVFDRPAVSTGAAVVQFDFAVNAASGAGVNTSAQFQVIAGKGLAKGYNANYFSVLSLYFGGTGNGNSATFGFMSGVKNAAANEQPSGTKVTWIISKEPTFTYTGPDGVSRTIAGAGNFHVYAGTTYLNRSAKPSFGGTGGTEGATYQGDMTDFQFRLGTTTDLTSVSIDNVSIGTLAANGTLSVSLK